MVISVILLIITPKRIVDHKTIILITIIGPIASPYDIPSKKIPQDQPQSPQYWQVKMKQNQSMKSSKK